jgi:aryl-alcohol dehydrogenase-like predicted oxidoreductase
MKSRIKTLNGTPASRFAFGTMQFGGRADFGAAGAMFDACRARGLNHFDTAHVYTGGLSETWLGRMVQSCRADILVATKVGYEGGAGRANILKQFDLSRRRLDLDQVDILYLHRFDPGTDLAETFETFAQLHGDGLIRYIGLSNFAAWQVVQATQIAAQFDQRIAIFQPMYSLLKRQAEVEILPMCAAMGIECAPYSPLGGGLLTGKYIGGQSQGRLTEDSRYAARYGAPWMQDTAQGLAALAEELAVPPATLAVAWVAAHRCGPTPIISARTLDQLTPSLDALDYPMPADLYARLGALSPAPAPATDRNEEDHP